MILSHHLVSQNFVNINTKLPILCYNTSLNKNIMLFEYTKIFIFALIASVVGLLLVTIAYLASKLRDKNREKLSTYECGFEPFDNATRLPFDVHFYIVGVLFLIFDVEVALLFP